MTQDDVIRMVREIADKDKVDPVHGDDPPLIVLTPDEMIRFANAVSGAERLRIAKLLEDQNLAELNDQEALQKYTAELLCALAEYIRLE